MSAFWNFVASVRDDVRHKVVEEGWYGRQVTGDTTVTPAGQEGQDKPPPEETRHTLYEQTWGKAPTHAEVYGQTPGNTQAAEPDPTPSQTQDHAPEL